ncbi:hypothetical protein ACHRVZ_04810 [Flavobacterium sp. FlaQc-57]|uniref:hypothetical protein n=1 Tax=Flavobacterium sp. FlaQc-57 TaxID=3374186 RepID=UPI0037566DA6
MEAENIGAYKSPEKKHAFDFIFEGEIRFGPPYFQIKLDGLILKNKIFGFEFKWHPESKYLALQEWLTTDYQKGPITILTIINLENRKIAQMSRTDKGFIKPLKFDDNKIIFEKEYFESGNKIEYEIKLEEIKNWE